MVIDIKDISGKIISSVTKNQDCERVEELMKADYAQLSWKSDTYDILPVGAYIEYKGEKLSLLEPYKPEQKDELEFSYKPQFQSRIMVWGKTPFFMYTYEDNVITNKEADWKLTDNPANFMKAVCDGIKNETGESWTYTIDASLPASTTLSFQSVDIFSALNEIANAFETEWWVDKVNNIVHLSKASYGKAVTLEVGKNINTPSITNGKEGYYTRFYAFGSTRNIIQDYGGANVNNLINKRLTLDPAKYPNGYKDIRPNLQQGEIFSKVLIFDYVYPSSKLSISDVRSRLMYRLDGKGERLEVGTDEEGNPVYDQYSIWYFQVPGYKFDEENIIEGKALSVHFESGALGGREFELNYHDKACTETSSDGIPFQVKAGDFEIKFIEEGTLIIPMMTSLVPANDDKIILFNIKMPDEYIESAYIDLEAALDKETERLSSDLNNYQFNSNPVEFYNSNPNLSIGRNVTYKNGSYSYSTRVIKLVTKMDYENDCNQTITIGNEKIKGNTQELKEEVTTANKDLNMLAVFNNMTSSLTQAYNRTQQLMLEGFAGIKDMWQFDPDNPDTIFSKYNVYSEKAVSAKGLNPGSGGGSSEGGATALYQLNDIAKDSTGANVLGASPGKVLTYGTDGKWYAANAGMDEDALGNYLTVHKYATQSWVLSQLENQYDLPIASDAVLGGVMIGSTLVASNTGVLDLNSVGVSGVYIKVTTDAYGRVVSGSSLLAEDIPELAISKITGLQGVLDDKLNKADFTSYFAIEIAKWFVRDVNGKAIYPAPYDNSEIGFYSNTFISAKGLNPNSGGGGGGVEYDRLDSWSDYDSSKSGWVLSAGLGYDLNTRVSALESQSITLATTGTGNGLSGFAQVGNVVTFTKATFLTEHQSLAGYATESWVIGKNYATISNVDDRINALINGAPEAFDTLKEISDVLQANVNQIDDLLTAIGSKADKAITIIAGTGLSGGGSLTSNRTISLKPATTSVLGGIIAGTTLSVSSNGTLDLKPEIATAGIYTKVTVDTYGRVTSGTSLIASDIPSLSISKITGLQDALDSKLTKTDFASYFATEIAKWLVRDVNNKAIYPATYNGNEIGFYTNTFISAMGVNPGSGSGGGGGMIESVYGYTDLGGTFSDNNLNDTFNAYTINRLASRITSLENSSLTEVPWGIITNKPNTLGGYGITDALLKTETAADSGKLGGFTPNVYDYMSAYDFKNGCLVRTSISASTNAMFFVHIMGNGYGSLREIDTTLQFYNYNDQNNIVNPSATNYGLNFGNISVFNYDGVVYLWFKQTGNFQTFFVYVHYMWGICNRITSITNAAKPTSGVTREVTVTPKNVALTTSEVTAAEYSYALRYAKAISDVNSPTLNGNFYELVLNSASTSTLNQPNVTDNACAVLTINKSKHGTSGYYTNQIFFDGVGRLYTRKSSNGTFTTWERILTSASYNLYAPTLTGGGASGTWGISITGNAGTATKLAAPKTLWGQGFDGTANISGNLTSVGHIQFTGASGAYSIGTASVAAASVFARNIQSDTTLYIKSGATSTSILFQLGTVEVARLSQPNGYLGLGIASPTERLHVSGNVKSTGYFENTASNLGLYNSAGSAYWFWNGTAWFANKPIVSSSTIQGTQLKSTIATGTAPLAVNSTTAVTNLNADMLDGVHFQNILERKYSGSADISSEGWYRIGQTKATDGEGTSFMFMIERSYYNTNNESYTFSVNIAYGAAITINQISGVANTKLISKIRVTGSSGSTYYVDIYINGTARNTYYWTSYGQMESYTTATSEPFEESYTCEVEPNTGIVTINNKSSISLYNRLIASKITAGYRVGHSMAVDLSNYNNGRIEFVYKGAGSTSNYMSIGFYGKDDIFNVLANGNVGIGTISPSYKLHVSGDIYTSTNVSSPTYMLSNSTTNPYMKLVLSGINWYVQAHNNYLYFGTGTTNALRIDSTGNTYIPGTLNAKIGIWSDGYVSAKGQNTTSDMRLKNKGRDIFLTVKEISEAPSFEYTWKDGTPGRMVGSSAQYWRLVNKNFAPIGPDKKHFEMMYGNLALTVGISLARHLDKLVGRVDTIEKRVIRLEKENRILREFKRKVEQQLIA